MRWTEIIKELKRLDDLDTEIREKSHNMTMLVTAEEQERLRAIENRVWFFSNLLVNTMKQEVIDANPKKSP